jgi:hypothetical protein
MSNRSKECDKSGHIVMCQDDGLFYCMYCFTKVNDE